MSGIFLVGGVILVLTLPLIARWFDGNSWKRNIVALQLRIPGTTSTSEVSRWLARVQVMTESPRWYLIPNTPIALEICSQSGSISHTLLVPERLRQSILASLHAALPGVRVTELPDYLTNRPRLVLGAEAVLTADRKPLDTSRVAETSQHILAALQPLKDGQRIYVQWIFSGVSRRPSKRNKVEHGHLFPDTGVLLEADDVRDEKLKLKTPLLLASLRVGVQASSKPAARKLYLRLWPAFAGMDTSGVRLLSRWSALSPLVCDRLSRCRVPVLNWMSLNTDEAAGLVGMASEGLRLPGIAGGVARVLPAPSWMAQRGQVVAESNYPGSSRSLALLRSDRLRHVWALGPTGTGKSTLLQNMIYQDMVAGDGLVVIDARGDLVYDLLDRVPEHRRDDVVLVDPTRTDRVVGFNPLTSGSGQRGRELAAEHILSVLHSVYHASWGNRTADVLRASLLTLVNAHGVNDSRLTMIDLPELLTNDQFRSFVLRQPMAPPLRTFWAWYNNLGVAERTAIISPVLNKLRSFVLSTPLRLTLGQSEGVDLSEVFTKRKIVLVPLKKGLLGAETTSLVGSLLMAGVWSATLARADAPPRSRRPAWLYCDEFQEVMRLPIDLADMLAQSRGLGLGMVLAHQYLGQLPPDLKAAVLGTARTQITFQVEHDDARSLAPRFAPLTADDLNGLGAHEVAIRPCVGGSTLGPVTGSTYPPVLPLGSTDDVVARSQATYAHDVTTVEAELGARIAADGTKRSNRRAKGGQS
ncbi:type IV secretory system conjugative DNA transfer family protein [Actinokineospora soli]|uniref:Type IV secretory system conjugative DNA transfer family protein n=1 Tax=Actinokineospora soli TaxID=1048753 RepID=A0ABW2THT3_9PSEU